MRLYFDILIFNFLQFVHYPLEILFSGLTKILTVVFLMIFWSLVLKETGETDQISYLLGYFMISGGIGSVTMSERMKLGSFYRKSIKTGLITNYLLKPYHLLLATYTGVMGDRSVDLIPSILMIIAGIWIIEPASFISMILFIYFLIIAIFIGFSFNLMEGIFSFYFTETRGLMAAFAHITRFLSGSFIPLNYFPSQIGMLLTFLPFSYVAYTPITALTVESVDNNVIASCLLGLFWAVVLNLFMYYFWKKGLKRYEAIGL